METVSKYWFSRCLLNYLRIVNKYRVPPPKKKALKFVLENHQCLFYFFIKVFQKELEYLFWKSFLTLEKCIIFENNDYYQWTFPDIFLWILYLWFFSFSIILKMIILAIFSFWVKLTSLVVSFFLEKIIKNSFSKTFICTFFRAHSGLFWWIHMYTLDKASYYIFLYYMPYKHNVIYRHV